MNVFGMCFKPWIQPITGSCSRQQRTPEQRWRQYGSICIDSSITNHTGRHRAMHASRQPKTNCIRVTILLLALYVGVGSCTACKSFYLERKDKEHPAYDKELSANVYMYIKQEFKSCKSAYFTQRDFCILCQRSSCFPCLMLALVQCHRSAGYY